MFFLFNKWVIHKFTTENSMNAYILLVGLNIPFLLWQLLFYFFFDVSIPLKTKKTLSLNACLLQNILLTSSIKRFETVKMD